MRPLLTQLLRFGIVGGIGLIIDVALFNTLRLTLLTPENIDTGPLIAKVISTTVAIASNWLGNRYWTFGPNRRPQIAREGAAFALVSIGGMLIGLACLWTSHYLLGYTSVLADNISGNVIGLALGTAFRFWLYRTWVFAPRHTTSSSPTTAPRASGAARSRATERPVHPAGITPLGRVQTVAPIDNRTTSHD